MPVESQVVGVGGICYVFSSGDAHREGKREVGGAAFVRIRETGMPRVASVPGEEVAGRAGFLPNSQGALETVVLQNVKAQTQNFTRKSSRCFEK